MDSQILKPDLWIVLDNSTTPAYDWSVAKDRSNVLYERIYEKRPIGWLRNRCIDLALENGADYIVFWDDDDYYPPTRISTGVNALEKDPSADISGSSKMYILIIPENVLMITGPFHDKHATAATLTIRRSYAEKHRFDPEKEKAEEVTFTKGWSANLIQVPAEEMIVVMGHWKNTVDKSQLVEKPQVFRAEFVNSDNGKVSFRSRWPVQWDLWKRTFSAAEHALPLENSSPEMVQTVKIPTPRIGGTGESSEHHA